MRRKKRTDRALKVVDSRGGGRTYRVDGVRMVGEWPVNVSWSDGTTCSAWLVIKEGRVAVGGQPYYDPDDRAYISIWKHSRSFRTDLDDSIKFTWSP